MRKTNTPVLSVATTPAKNITDRIDSALTELSATAPISETSESIQVANDQIMASLPSPSIYYDSNAQKPFLIPKADEGWIAVTQQQAMKQLKSWGFNPETEKDEPLSEVDQAVLQIQCDGFVDYAGDLAGHHAGYYVINDSRVLVTSSPRKITPKPGPWDLIRCVTENLFGNDQLPYVYSWLKLSHEMYLTGCWQAGQAFVMCGPKGAGKNLFVQIMKELFGGRSSDAYQFMTDRTNFNYDLFGTELLTVEDKAEYTKIQARRSFGAQIKGIAVNEDQRCHPKHGKGRTLKPLWRLAISLNDDPERLMVLPPLDDDIDDKIMLFKVYKHSMPMPTKTGKQQKQFEEAWKAELPAFAHFLSEWTIPESLQVDRFGVSHYHHPDLVDALKETAPEKALWELIEEVLFGSAYQPTAWEGEARALQRLLTAEDSPSAREAAKILSYTNSCGNYLGRLARQMPDRISRRMLNGRTIWIINPEEIVPSEAAIKLRERLVASVRKSGTTGLAAYP